MFADAFGIIEKSMVLFLCPQTQLFNIIKCGRAAEGGFFMIGEEDREARFSRSVANHAKAGAYYTDPSHCEAMCRFLSFPEEEVTCLDPSIGNGEALKAACGKKEGDQKRLFGVDVSKEAVSVAGSDPLTEQVIEGDFTRDVIISQKSFSFVFSNPPYMAAEDQVRYEERFLEKITPLLKTGGVLFYVIPYGQFTTKKLFLKLINRYEVIHAYRFREKEYAKFHQVVVMSVKRAANANLTGSERDAALEGYLVEEDLPELPFDYDGERIAVPPGSASAIASFTTAAFPAREALLAMNDASRLSGEAVRAYRQSVGARITVRGWKGAEIGRPPIHPNKGSMYLLGICGAGTGSCGSEEEGTLHLERGVVKMIEEEQRVASERKDAPDQIVVTRRAQVTYNVIEANGRITNLS